MDDYACVYQVDLERAFDPGFLFLNQNYLDGMGLISTANL